MAKIVLVIPAYNEAERIATVVEKAAPLVDRVVVIDDGSTDKTFTKAQSAGALVLRHRINLGKGAALKTGCEAARSLGAEIIILMDGDGQHPPEEIPKILEKFDSQYDAVLTIRQFNRTMPPIMLLGNLILTATARLLFKIRINDLTCGLRAFRKEAYEKIKWRSSGYAVETEIAINITQAGLNYAVVPIETIYFNAYKGTTFIDGLKIFLNMLIWRLIR